MRLPTISLLLLITASSKKTSKTSCDAFQSSSLSIISRHHHYRKATTATATTTTLSSNSNNNDDDSGWYDDYDDFVQKLDFENDSGWDSGADVPFDGSYDNAGNSRRGRGGGGRGGRGGGRGNFNRGNYGGGVGHDYQRDPNDFGSVDERVVNDLLSQRLQFRKRKMFDEADDIRDELLNVHGVTIWDRDLMWTTARGGRGGGGGRGRGGGGGRFDRNGGRGGRGSGRGRGRERQFNEFGHDYSQVGGPIDTSVCTLSENEIHSMIRERMECKFARDFRVADQIEQELTQAGVNVHDGFKEWRADGEGWRRSNRRDDNFNDGPRTPKIYQQRGPGKGLTGEQIDEINALVAERSECKAETNYARADEIFNELADRYNVNVDDRNGEWSLLSEEYLLSPDTTLVPEEKVQVEIEKKLGERILARKARNFALADEIRDELEEDYLVEIDDRSKEWLIMMPEGGRWADDDDEEEDETNIVSEDEWDSDGSFDEDEEEDEDDEGSSNVQAAIDEGALSSMTVPELKEELRNKGLPVSGRKSELIDRLLNSA